MSRSLLIRALFLFTPMCHISSFVTHFAINFAPAKEAKEAPNRKGINDIDAISFLFVRTIQQDTNAEQDSHGCCGHPDNLKVGAGNIEVMQLHVSQWLHSDIAS